MLGINEWAHIWLKRNYYGYYVPYLFALLAGGAWMCSRANNGRLRGSVLTGTLVGLASGWLAGILMPGIAGRDRLPDLLMRPETYWQAAVFAGLVMAWAGGLIMGALLWVLETNLSRGLKTVSAAVVLAAGVEILRYGVGWDRGWIRF